MNPRGLVVVGASAGGVEALRSFVGGLPAGLEAAVCVVLHIPRDATSALPRILSHAGCLPAVPATDGGVLEAGQIYVAPANAHLMISGRRTKLSRGPAENGHRPAVDPLFRSAAHSWGRNAVGVVLSGTRDDGTAGLIAIAEHGGGALVQDLREALYQAMPRNAGEQVTTARMMPVSAMGAAIGELVLAMPVLDFDAGWNAGSTWKPVSTWSADSGSQAEDAMADLADITADEMGATPAGFGCPSCNGALFELPGQPAPRFRCRVGHAWSADGLIDAQSDGLEDALWMALRSLEEKAAMSRRMATAAADRGNAISAARYGEVSADSERAGKVIRDLLDRLL